MDHEIFFPGHQQKRFPPATMSLCLFVHRGQGDLVGTAFTLAAECSSKPRRRRIFESGDGCNRVPPPLLSANRPALLSRMTRRAIYQVGAKSSRPIYEGITPGEFDPKSLSFFFVGLHYTMGIGGVGVMRDVNYHA